MTMRTRNPYQAYKTDEILTLSPIGLVVRVLNTAIQSLGRARQSAGDGSAIRCRDEVNRARALISELRGALDHTRGGNIANDLDRLYEFVIASILRSGATPDVRVLQEAEGILIKVREGFDAVLANEASAMATS